MMTSTQQTTGDVKDMLEMTAAFTDKKNDDKIIDDDKIDKDQDAALQVLKSFNRDGEPPQKSPVTTRLPPFTFVVVLTHAL
jgi:hypothetical protein